MVLEKNGENQTDRKNRLVLDLVEDNMTLLNDTRTAHKRGGTSRHAGELIREGVMEEGT